MNKKKFKYTPKLKKEVCEYALRDNINNSAKFHNLHRETVSNWVKNYKLYGEKSFSFRKKRNDNQKKKLDENTLLKIKEIKDDNPKLSLKDIKKQLNLNCDISLISRKLSNLKEESKIKSFQEKPATFLSLLMFNLPKE